MIEFHAGKCHYETHYYKQLIHANKSIKAVYCYLQNLRVHYNLTVTLFFLISHFYTLLVKRFIVAVPEEGNLVIRIKITNAYSLCPSPSTSINASRSDIRTHAKWYIWISYHRTVRSSTGLEAPTPPLPWTGSCIFFSLNFHSLTVENKTRTGFLSPAQSTRTINIFSSFFSLPTLWTCQGWNPFHWETALGSVGTSVQPLGCTE